MIHSKYFPVIITGFAAGVLTTVPGLKSFGCCLLVPAAAIFALHIDKRIEGYLTKITPSHAIVFGLLTGVAAALFSTTFEVLITFITKRNDIVDALPIIAQQMSEFKFLDPDGLALDMLNSIANDIIEYGFSPLYAFILFFNNLFSFAIFGLIGGLAGMGILNSKIKKLNR
ncbi:MAG: hypothetical protein IAE91_04460 [Ignavibacteriaceae bacterium]|nr:hypothetical protein [Ignavibacteriaceae bacterium]